MSSMPNVHSRIDGSIGWIVFDNAARLNAMSLSMWAAIPAIVERFQSDGAVRAIVMTGAGDDAFVSGADISEFEAHRSDAAAAALYNDTGEQAFESLKTLTKPLVARIDGYCIGGGLGLALACDVRIASDRSRFAIPAGRLGLGYGFAHVKRLVDVVGPSFAQEILFSARHFNAVEAQTMGLVNRIVAANELDAVVADLTRRCAENAPLTLAAAKLAVRMAQAAFDDRDTEAVGAAVGRCFASEDYVEGRSAFMAKRKPLFKGR